MKDNYKANSLKHSYRWCVHLRTYTKWKKKQYFAKLVISKHKRIYESFLRSLKQSLLVSKGFIGLGNSMFPDNENPEYHPVLEGHLPTPHQASEMILSLVLEGVSWMYREFTSNGFCGMENRIWAAVRSAVYCSSFTRPNRNRNRKKSNRTEKTEQIENSITNFRNR